MVVGDRVRRVGRVRWVAFAVLLQVALVAWFARAHGVDDRAAAVWVPRLFLLQHAGAHAVLAGLFGSTLRPGRRPMIERVAARLHRLSPAMRAYIRRLTWAWTIYFAAMATASCAIFAAFDVRQWAVFAELGTPLLLSTMFVGEHRLRYRLHPEFDRVGLRAAVRAYRHRGAGMSTW